MRSLGAQNSVCPWCVQAFGVGGFKGCIIKAWSGTLDTALSVGEVSVTEAAVAHFSLFVAQGGLYLCTLSFV